MNHHAHMVPRKSPSFQLGIHSLDERCRAETSDGRNPDLAEAERLVMDAEMAERAREADESEFPEGRPEEIDFGSGQEASGMLFPVSSRL